MEPKRIESKVAQLLLHQAAGEDVGQPAAAVRLGQHEGGEADSRRGVPDLPRDLGVGLVDRGRRGPDLARGEVAADALDLLLLRRQLDHRPSRTIACPAVEGPALESLFAPRSVAVVGASDDPAKWGNWLAHGALRGASRRAVHLVNLAGGDVLGRPAHRSLRAIGAPVELVVAAVPGARASGGGGRRAGGRRACDRRDQLGRRARRSCIGRGRISPTAWSRSRSSRPPTCARRPPVFRARFERESKHPPRRSSTRTVIPGLRRRRGSRRRAPTWRCASWREPISRGPARAGGATGAAPGRFVPIVEQAGKGAARRGARPRARPSRRQAGQRADRQRVAVVTQHEHQRRRRDQQQHQDEHRCRDQRDGRLTGGAGGWATALNRSAPCRGSGLPGRARSGARRPRGSPDAPRW